MWYNISEENKEKVCSFSPSGWERFKKYAKKRGFTQFCVYNNDVPVEYFLKTGTTKGYDELGSDVKSNPCALRYPFIDHAFYVRDTEDHVALVTNTYNSKCGVCRDISSLLMYYGSIDVFILGRSFYEDGTTSVVIEQA